MGRSEMWRLKSFLVRVDLSLAQFCRYNFIGHPSDQYLRVHEQENWTLFRIDSLSSVWDVGTRRKSILRCDQWRDKGGVPKQHIDGVFIHSNVFRNVGLWHTWRFVFRESGEWLPYRPIFEMEEIGWESIPSQRFFVFRFYDSSL